MALIKSISGIRGTIGGKTGENLTPLDVVKFTAAYGSWLLQKSKNKKVVVGRDAAHDERDRDGRSIARQHAGQRDEQEDRGEQLRRDHQGTVFNIRVRITKVVNILTRGSLLRLSASFHSVRPLPVAR